MRFGGGVWALVRQSLEYDKNSAPPTANRLTTRINERLSFMLEPPLTELGRVNERHQGESHEPWRLKRRVNYDFCVGICEKT